MSKRKREREKKRRIVLTFGNYWLETN